MTLRVPLTAGDIKTRYDEHIIPSSHTTVDSTTLWTSRTGNEKALDILAVESDQILNRFQGVLERRGTNCSLKRCPRNGPNAGVLRDLLPNLRPRPLGLATSVGFGDRLGMATYGHVQALNDIAAMPQQARFAPIFAQQSVRENTRTHRTPLDVLNDATWGCFEAGWRSVVGADADHLKTQADIDTFADVGYSLFTIDPGLLVDPSADALAGSDLEAKLTEFPWDILETTERDLLRRYSKLVVGLESRQLEFEGGDIARAVAKYGRSIAHIAAMVRHVASKGVAHEIEISVDETDSPTSPIEHYFIANELRRLGVTWVGLAPRLPGRFEKGVDYIGDLSSLQQALALHSEIARTLGPYKLSLHSGSDKFSVYPVLAEATRGLVHLKTAGTSYLEALRVIAKFVPTLFRDIVRCAADAYPRDRASYHVSATVDCLQDVDKMADQDLADLLDQVEPREVLHVTFGSVLERFRAQLQAELRHHESDYVAVLRAHFKRHLLPFISQTSGGDPTLQER